jgi:RNA polymerase sigma factor (sigma-70 family)
MVYGRGPTPQRRRAWRWGSQRHRVEVDGYFAGAVILDGNRLVACNLNGTEIESLDLFLRGGCSRAEWDAAIVRVLPVAIAVVKKHFESVRRIGGGNQPFLHRREPIPAERTRGDAPKLNLDRSALLEASIPSVRRLARRFCRSYQNLNLDHEDVFSELIVGLCQKLGGYNPEAASFGTYLAVVAKTSFYDYLRKMRSPEGITKTGGAKVELVFIHDEVKSDDGDMLREDVLGDVWDVGAAAAVGILSPQEYQIFAEIAFDGKSIADIAKELGVSDKYVYRINARTTQKIKDYLSSSLSDTAACA